MVELSRDDLVERLTALGPRLMAEGVTSLALFGSRARGDHRADSDIDLLIDVDPAARFSLIDLVTIAHCIEDDIGLRANIFLRRSLDERFRREAVRDAVPVFP